METNHCIIIGGSHAAAQLAHSLRLERWTGSISLISNEHLPPYHRPPLSKSFLADRTPENQLLIRPATFYDKNSIALRLNTQVTAIDPAGHFVRTADGRRISYTKLALATGAQVRKLDVPGSELQGVFYLRNLADAESMRPSIAPGKSVVIVGGGYIGLETAACLRKLGLQVTLVEFLPRLLQRVSAPEVADFYRRIHAEEGVEILTGTSVAAFEGNNAVRQVRCTNGRVIMADFVVIGIGISPNTQLARTAGLSVKNGIIVDDFCRTSDPDIVAAGDCTNHFNAIYNRNIRLESVQNAVEQAQAAANTLCGKLKPYQSLPWFWSDQYDLKLQIAGLSAGFDQVIIRGSPDVDRSFAAFYFRQGRFIAVDAVNRPMEFMLGKRALARGFNPDPETIGNDSLPVQSLLNPG